MRTVIKHGLIAAILLGSLAGTAQAAMISTLYSTGVDNGGALLANGAVDPHYSVTPGSGPFVIGNPANFGWAGNTASSQWISPDPSTFAGGGPFTYTTIFDLTGLDPGTAQISGFWASDNDATVFLNGNSVGSDPVPGWFQLAAFSITSGFQAGLNTLTFIVLNNEATSNDGPTGLQVQITSATADVPEPSTLALGGLTLVLWFGSSRRRAGRFT